MSASTSCSDRAVEALEAIRRGEKLHDAETRSLGEQCPAEFFRIIVEALSDSFEPAQIEAYRELMRAWIPPVRLCDNPPVPEEVDRVYVLSRVTLGSDIKITSAILNAMKNRFSQSSILFVGSRKSAELFAGDSRIEHMEVDYPRSGR